MVEMKNKATLHTDLLEALYGEVSVQVLEQDDYRRVVDILDKNRVTRTHAVTWLPEIETDDPIRGLREEIRLGGSIGKTVRAYGYGIDKRMILSCNIGECEWLESRMQCRDLAINLYEFWVNAEGVKALIGTILEIYPSEVKAISNNPDAMIDISSDKERLTTCTKAMGYILGGNDN